MKQQSLTALLAGNTYPGRGIMAGRTEDGTRAVLAYFIMGRSGNSRNRIFVEDGDGIRTKAYDESKLEDPSLIIYAPVRVHGTRTIVTNGDQTDTIFDGLERGLTPQQALSSRRYEPDGPNYTPRISCVLDAEGEEPVCELSILKSADGNPAADHRYTFTYAPLLPGEGHFISTYLHDGDPLPSFEGEPIRVAVENADIGSFTEAVWEALNPDNRVSLFTRYIDLKSGKWESRIINRHGDVKEVE